MKTPFPRTHSLTVHHPISEFCLLTMDCGADISQPAIVFDPTEDFAPQERQPITCRDCLSAEKVILPGSTTYEYGLVDIRALREWERSRGRGQEEGAV